MRLLFRLEYRLRSEFNPWIGSWTGVRSDRLEINFKTLTTTVIVNASGTLGPVTISQLDVQKDVRNLEGSRWLGSIFMSTRVQTFHRQPHRTVDIWAQGIRDNDRSSDRAELVVLCPN